MKRTIRFRLNTQEHSVSLEKETLALDWIRNTALLKGTKEGCREGDCGACMIILGERINGAITYRAATSCTLGLSDLDGKHVITIEGIAEAGLTPVMRAFLDEGASQCGFCSPGFIVSLTAMFLEGGPIDYRRALTAIEGNLCRCTGYGSIRKAAAELAKAYPSLPADFSARLAFLAEAGIIPRALATTMHSLPAPVGEQLPATKTLGGGTDFFVQNPDPENSLVPGYTDQEPDAQRIKEEHGCIVIGSAVTMRDFFASPELRKLAPGIEQFEEFIASLPIRNRATLAGNIANASPIADMTSILIALGAELALTDSAGKQRRLLLADAFIGYKKLAFSEGERIAGIVLKAEPVRLSFEKVAKRAHLDIASVNSALVVREDQDGTIREARLSFGGVGPTPLSITAVAALLCGKKATATLVRSLAEAAVAEAKPISDVRGSADYRTRLVYRLVLAHALRLWPALEEELLP